MVQLHGETPSASTLASTPSPLALQETAAATVEGVHSEWQSNQDWLDVRCVQSGYFQYRTSDAVLVVSLRLMALLLGVDFSTMTQTNLRTSKCRKIRRVAM